MIAVNAENIQTTESISRIVLAVTLAPVGMQ